MKSSTKTPPVAKAALLNCASLIRGPLIRGPLICGPLICATVICGCTSSVTTDPTKLSHVEIKGQSGETLKTGAPKTGAPPNKDGVFSPEIATADANGGGIPVAVDMDAERAIAKESLEAWRTALKGDEKTALAKLDDLEKRYPTISTVKFMKAQVYEHFNKRELAIKYYRESLDNSEFSSLRQFKLAEALKKGKQYKEAEEIYRKLLKTFSDLPDAKLGLALCLIAQDKDSKEGHQVLAETVILCEALMKTREPGKVASAKRILKDLLEADPGNAAAKQLLGQ